MLHVLTYYDLLWPVGQIRPIIMYKPTHQSIKYKFKKKNFSQTVYEKLKNNRLFFLNYI